MEVLARCEGRQQLDQPAWDSLTEELIDMSETKIQSNDLLALRIRSLIADKEMVTATANLDLVRGGEWRCDYQAWHGKIDTEINALLSEANSQADQP